MSSLNDALLDSRTFSNVSADQIILAARWEHLAIFFCLTCASQISWIMYSSVPRVAATAFDATRGTQSRTMIP